MMTKFTQRLFGLDKIRVFLVFLFYLSMAFSTALNNICFVLLIACGLYYTAKEGINVRLSRTSILSIVIVALLLIDIVVFAETPKDYKVGLRYLILLCTPII